MKAQEKKDMVLQAIRLKMEMLQPMLVYANLTLTMPTSEATLPVLHAAERWLDGFLKVNTVFMAAYTQPHTGEEFWKNLKVTGIPKGSLFSDLPAAKEMRGILHRVHMKFNSRPEVFGGTAKAARKPRAKDTEGDSGETTS